MASCGSCQNRSGILPRRSSLFLQALSAAQLDGLRHRRAGTGIVLGKPTAPDLLQASPHVGSKPRERFVGLLDRSACL